jgi:pilus assembly protein Flp/PilA
MRNKLIAYFKDESGQTSTEYILLVAVAAAIVVKFKTVIISKLGLGQEGGGVMGSVFDKVGSEIDSM